MDGAKMAGQPVAADDAFEWEVRDSTTPFWQHAVAGSSAGIAEHVSMYPLDTLKTRMGASQVDVTLSSTLRDVLRERGAPGLMRGSLVIGAGCVPAHVGLFSTYEFAKSALLDADSAEHQPARAAACGAAATLVHDVILTPCDVVKQRLQQGRYAGALDCVSKTLGHEGMGAFYRSLPTTLVMNVPYMGMLVAMNESLKKVLHIGTGGTQAGEGSLSGAPWYFFSAGVSGAFAATATMPLDVVKTRLQTQGGEQAPLAASGAPKYTGFVSTIRTILEQEGGKGFFRGLGPRVGLAMPSAAVCWGTYETVRMALTRYSGDTTDLGTGSTVDASSLEWEEWDGSNPFWQHAAAGSCAGVMEHVAMYPVDTIKTRMQACAVEPGGRAPGVAETVRVVLREQGASGLMRGCFAIGVGCIPAHVGLFCTYEFAKVRLMDPRVAEHQPVQAAACGALATIVHDMIITPTDVVKQRLQLGRYSGIADCVVSMWRHEGPLAFYRSLPTTLIAECPFHGVLVASNESLKVLLGLEKRGDVQSDSRVPVAMHFVSTGLSGMFAAVVTQPLDVVKTRLQTQSVAAGAEGEVVVRYSGMVSTARLIWREEGVAGLFRGTVPRLVFAAPSAAMCWGTYEVMKRLLGGSL